MQKTDLTKVEIKVSKSDIYDQNLPHWYSLHNKQYAFEDGVKARYSDPLLKARIVEVLIKLEADNCTDQEHI